jgi:ferredoxin
MTFHAPPAEAYGTGDLVIVAVPVYGGHVAPSAMQRMEGLRGNGALAVAVVVYGNRHYEHALEELADFLGARGFHLIGAGTFIGEHSYSTPATPIAVGRPDTEDMACAMMFGEGIARKLSSTHPDDAVDARQIEQPEQDVQVMMHFKQTVMGWMKDGMQMPSAPIVDEALCTHCDACAGICPTGAIVDNRAEAGKCIKCCACVKGCPTGARSFSTPFAPLLAKNFSKRKENKFMI